MPGENRIVSAGWWHPELVPSPKTPPLTLVQCPQVKTWEGASEGGAPRNRGRRECQQPRTFWGPFPEADRPTWLRSVIKTSGEQEHQ